MTEGLNGWLNWFSFSLFDAFCIFFHLFLGLEDIWSKSVYTFHDHFPHFTFNDIERACNDVTGGLNGWLKWFYISLLDAFCIVFHFLGLSVFTFHGHFPHFTFKDIELACIDVTGDDGCDWVASDWSAFHNCHIPWPTQYQISESLKLKVKTRSEHLNARNFIICQNKFLHLPSYIRDRINIHAKM